MIVDVEKCVGCFNCMLACKDEHVGNRWMPYTDEQRKHGDKWINPTSYERGKAPYTEFCFVTRTCYQCDNPACMEKFPDEIYKREDGIVIIDPQKAKGKKEIVGACPYGQIHWNEERNLPQKCTGCAHLIDEGWERPRCVQACPLRAINTVYCEEDEWEKIIVNQGLKSILPMTAISRECFTKIFTDITGALLKVRYSLKAAKLKNLRWMQMSHFI